MMDRMLQPRPKYLVMSVLIENKSQMPV